jgi:hypothetical protein
MSAKRTDWKKLAGVYKNEYEANMKDLRDKQRQIGDMLIELRRLRTQETNRANQMCEARRLFHTAKQAQAIAASIAERNSQHVEAAALRDTAKRLGDAIEACRKVEIP